MPSPVVIVGAGVAGLTCALDLVTAGVEVLVLEAGDRPGGRVRTDLVDGFRCDRGFQVLLTAYPEAQRVLDYAALDLRPFYPGALVRHGGRFHRVADPRRHPLQAALGAFSPIGTLRDKWKVGAMRTDVGAGAPQALLERPEVASAQALAARGFTPAMVDRFFRPFFGGVFLERELSTSSRLLDYLFRMFCEGDVAVPAKGMGEIPRQMAAKLPANALRVASHVATVASHRVTLTTGEPIAASAVVVATEPAEAAALLDLPTPPMRGVVNYQFAAEHDPVGAPVLVLNAEPGAVVNDLAVMSAVSAEYAPAGQALVSVSTPGAGLVEEAAVRAELATWFGDEVKAWRRLAVHRIPAALPAFEAPTGASVEKPPQVRPGVFVAGDHRETPSLQGAMASGRRAAEAVLRSTGARATATGR